MPDIISHPVFIVFCVCFLIHIFVFVYFYCRFAFGKTETRQPSVLPPLSVIISAKNEENNLREFIPSVLEQDYPEFEVIVINDQSEDDTGFVLTDFEKHYSNLHIVTIKDHIRDFPGKKLAITLGIRKSVNKYLVFTDADCKPAGKNWLRSIASSFDDHTDIVLGYSPYFKKNTLLNLFIQFDTFYTALQYFSFTLAKLPYMGVGRNLAYRRELFLKNGFSSYLHIPYGDDDLFVNKNATSENVKIMVDPESFVYSRPKESFSKWKRQKIRHIKAGKEYKRSDKNRLGLVWLSQVLFYLSFVPAAILFPSNFILWGVFALKMIFCLLVYAKALKRLNQIRLIYFIPFIGPIYHLLLLPDFSLSAYTSKRNVW